MPDMPTMDAQGLTELMAIILASLAVLWGINKAIHIAKK